MQYTNKLKLPDFVVHALANDDYKKSERENSISATTLISPPYIVQTRKKYDDLIEVDVSSRMWSMLGQIGHSIVGRLDGFENIDDYIIEKRFENKISYTDQFGKLQETYINGQPDLFNHKEGILYDNKFTTHWAAKGKIEWTQQLNIYAWLLRHNGYEVNEIYVIAWLRDLTAIDKLKHNTPDQDIIQIPVPVWTQDECTRFIIDRLRYHAIEATECNEEERWAKAPKYAVVKEVGKRALKLYDDIDSAYKNLKSGYQVEYRPGSNPRCEMYCELTKFCNFYRNKYGEVNGNN